MIDPLLIDQLYDEDAARLENDLATHFPWHQWRVIRLLDIERYPLLFRVQAGLVMEYLIVELTVQGVYRVQQSISRYYLRGETEKVARRFGEMMVASCDEFRRRNTRNDDGFC